MTIGEIYTINHRRKGLFNIKLIEESPEWFKGEIVAGTAKMVAHFTDDLTVGDIVNCKKSLCTIT